MEISRILKLIDGIKYASMKNIDGVVS